jgi:hypothetical protein
VKIPGRIVLSLLWLLSASAGAWGLLKYENTPGGANETPSQWPSESRVTRQEGRSTLLVFMHPRCPCSRASLGELNRLLTRCEGEVSTHVFFIQPKDSTADWTETALQKSAEAIPGVNVQLDPEGEEARRFGAESSGYVALYNSKGQLLFSGGITAARGHAGDNAGENTIVALLNGENTRLKQTPVFGCCLRNQCAISIK